MIGVTPDRQCGVRRGLILVLGSVLVTACFQQSLPDLSHLPEAPEAFPHLKYETLAAQGWQLKSVDPKRTQIIARVYKAGRLARLGHNHIVSTQQPQGRVALHNDRSKADLFVRLDQLEIDRPDLRALAGPGFESTPDAEDVSGTRANMLSDKVMSAPVWPFAMATIEGEIGSRAESLWRTRLNLHGHSHDILVPVVVNRNSDEITVEGRIDQLDLSAFQIPQFSILGGAVRVAEQVDIGFSIVVDTSAR